jgi:hypothetical protein
MAQGLRHRHGQAAYAQLHRGSVRNEADHLSRDLAMNLGRCRLELLGQGPVGLGSDHDLAGVYAGLTANGRDAVVDLHHHRPRRLDRIPGIVDGTGRAVIALRVGR